MLSDPCFKPNSFYIFLTLFFLNLLPINSYASDNDTSRFETGKLKSALPNIEYDEEKEYKIHQEVSNRFFKRISRHKKARDIIAEFPPRYSHTRYDLAGLSSRTRVLLFREMIMRANNIGYTNPIPFKLYKREFTITPNPSLRHLGNGEISHIGTCQKICSVLKEFPSYGTSVAFKLLLARVYGSGNHCQPVSQDNPFLGKKGNGIFLEMLDVFLDFEIARRLQSPEEEYVVYYCPIQEEFIKKLQENLENMLTQSFNRDSDNQRRLGYDSIPIASAVTGALKLTEDNNANFYRFFQSNPKDPLDSYNAFEGEPNVREAATKKIIKVFNKKFNKGKNSTREQVHQAYIKVFGKGSESDNDSDYDDLIDFKERLTERDLKTMLEEADIDINQVSEDRKAVLAYRFIQNLLNSSNRWNIKRLISLPASDLRAILHNKEAIEIYNNEEKLYFSDIKRLYIFSKENLFDFITILRKAREVFDNLEGNKHKEKISNFIRLYSENPLHIECLMEEDAAYDIALKTFPNINPIVIKYLEGNNLIDKVRKQLEKKDQRIFKALLEDYYGSKSPHHSDSDSG